MRGERAIAWTVRETTLGTLLVAASERGVCRIAFGSSEEELAALLARELPFARLERDRGAVVAFADAIARAVEGDAAPVELPLDVAGSRFQERVWTALRAIPRGEVRSYGEVAAAIGAPRAVRAVANACGANPVAIAVPCHRVVARGGIGGYRYGPERKRALLAREAARNAKGPAVPAGPRFDAFAVRL
ncbi:MAG TPA: methylated-DNA--[protein]-cysteine S-methyltransferase [Myxococcota bacterium]|nr:methylated-DNA--[protein]-cysteine S-methyltransferase [Myxococcota bacterium]